MSEYLDIEAQVEGEEQQDFEQDDHESSGNEGLIDDNTEGNDLSFYRAVDNQLQNLGDVDSILEQELNEQYKEAENLEPNNLLYEGEIIQEQVELKNQKISLKKFKKTFYPRNNDSDKPQSLTFKKALQYAVRFLKHDLKDQCENFENYNVANQFDDDFKDRARFK